MPELTEKNLAARAGKVGASEVAALLPGDRHPYASRASLYAKLVNGIDTFAGNPDAARLGHEAEATIQRAGIARTGLRVRANSYTYTHPTLPIVATPDGLVLHTDDLVEYKLVSGYMSEEWADGPPFHYIVQVQTQMLLTKRTRCHVWAQIGSTRFVQYIVDADPAIQAEIEDAVEAFYRDHITPRIPPEDVPAELMLTVYAPEGSGPADDEADTIGVMISDLMAEQDSVKAALDNAREGLVNWMVREGLSFVSGPTWTAEATKSAKAGKVGLRFTRRGKR